MILTPVNMKESESGNLPDISGMTYSEAVEELEIILGRLRAENCDVDSLVSMTRRATELLEACRNRLVVTEQELSAILDKN